MELLFCSIAWEEHCAFIFVAKMLHGRLTRGPPSVFCYPTSSGIGKSVDIEQLIETSFHVNLLMQHSIVSRNTMGRQITRFI